MTPEAEVAAVASIVGDEDEGRPVRIKWTDSGMAVHGWQQRDSIAPTMPAIETVGLWMGESADVVMVGGSRDPNNSNWGECQLIWKPSITSKEWLS